MPTRPAVIISPPRKAVGSPRVSDTQGSNGLAEFQWAAARRLNRARRRGRLASGAARRGFRRCWNTLPVRRRLFTGQLLGVRRYPWTSVSVDSATSHYTTKFGQGCMVIGRPPAPMPREVKPDRCGGLGGAPAFSARPPLFGAPLGSSLRRSEMIRRLCRAVLDAEYLPSPDGRMVRARQHYRNMLSDRTFGRT